MNIDSKQIHLKVLLVLLLWAAKWRLLLSWWSINEIDLALGQTQKLLLQRELFLTPFMR